MKFYILYICVVMAASVTRSCSTLAEGGYEMPPVVSTPLADSLAQVYDSAHSAAVDRRLTDFVELADTNFWNELELLSKRYGFNTVQSYLGQQAFYWPDIDTLRITEVRESGQYLRLTAMGHCRKSASLPERIQYTFILFQRTDEGLLMSGLTNLEKNQHDSYGYSTSYSELELPPELRFPRQF